jgi:uncharacterized protein (TIGR02145 family)
MVENLKTTKFNDGISIPNMNLDNEWYALSSAGYCWYNNDTVNKNTYGALYNWYTVTNSKFCPQGWHIPSDSEWVTLITNLGGESVAGGLLKEPGTTHWLNPNTGATNQAGLALLPGGYRNYSGTFLGMGFGAYFWSSTDIDPATVLGLSIYCNAGNVKRDTVSKELGLSVHCIKD